MADGDSTSSPPRTPSDDTPTDEENRSETMADGKIIEVKCGPLTAKMHVEQFVCPGIHQVCIELDGEMISPKEFTIRANKDKQKDWKGSIRIGKSNLRTLMEMRSFDFYNHQQFCSAKCQSRNYITPKEKDPDRDSRRNSTASQKGTPLPLFGGPLLAQQNLGGIFKEATTFSQLMQLSSVLNNNNPPATTPKIEQKFLKEELVDVDDSFTEVSSTPSPPSPEQLLRLMNSEPQLFWAEVRQMGLLEEVVDQMVAALYKNRDSAANGGLATVAPLLSRVVSSLSITDSVLNLISTRQFTKRSHDKPRLSSDFSYLEDSDTRKRSIDEGSSVSQSSPEVKRPRVQYPVGITPVEGLESNFLQALLQAQLQLCQPSVDVLLQMTKAPQIPLTNPLLSISKD